MKRTLLLAACLLLSGRVFAAVADGYVVKVDSATVYLDWGNKSNVQSGDRFNVYRAGEPLKHPVTGEILGQSETSLGSGRIDSVEEKFSIGQLDPAQPAVKPGDRTRWLSHPSMSVVPAPEAAGTSLDNAPKAPAITELWRSEPLEKDAVGLAFGDLNGDGQQDVVIAYQNKVQVYGFKDKKLTPIASFDNRSFRHCLAVDVMDVKHDGHMQIFATTYLDGINRPRVLVLQLVNGALKQVGDFEGFARVIPRMDGTRHLYWQDLSRSRDASFSAASEITWEKDKYKPGKPLDLKLFNDQLFGYAWGDWTKSGKEEFGVLEHGDRIRIYSQDIKWKSDEVYGGTKNDFAQDNNKSGSLFPRLIVWHPAQSDRDLLLVPSNIPELGIHFTYLKIYKRSQIDALQWNGLELKSAWKIPIQGYVADIGLADLLGQSKPQLWAAATGPGDKTILLAYNLP